MTGSLRAVALLTAVLAIACGDAPTEPDALQNDAAMLELVHTTLRGLAEQGIGAAAAAQARCDAGSAVGRDGVSVRRGRRLLAHAREAINEGEVGLALQRARYAEALLDGECPAAVQGAGIDR